MFSKPLLWAPHSCQRGPKIARDLIADQYSPKISNFVLLCSQLIADMLEFSKLNSKEMKIAKRENTEKMKEHESQLSSLEKRLKKLDVEKENLNARLVDLQSARSNLGSS